MLCSSSWATASDNEQVNGSPRLLDAAEKFLPPFKNVSIVSMHPKLGDTIVALAPLLAFMQQRYPETKLTLYSVFSDLFVPHDRFESKPMHPLGSYVPEFLKNEGHQVMKPDFFHTFVPWVFSQFFDKIQKSSDLIFQHAIYDYDRLAPGHMYFDDEGDLDPNKLAILAIALDYFINEYFLRFDTPFVFYPYHSKYGNSKEKVSRPGTTMKIKGKFAFIGAKLHESELTGNTYQASIHGLSYYLSGSKPDVFNGGAKHFFVPPKGSSDHQHLARLGVKPGAFIFVNIQGGRLMSSLWFLPILAEFLTTITDHVVSNQMQIVMGHWDPRDALEAVPELSRYVKNVRMLLDAGKAAYFIQLPNYKEYPNLHATAMDESHKNILFDTGIVHIGNFIDHRKQMVIMHQESEKWQLESTKANYFVYHPKKYNDVFFFSNDPQKDKLIQDVTRFLTEPHCE